jgi:hypothetical protein
MDAPALALFVITDVLVPVALSVVKLPAAAVPPPIAPGAANVAPFRLDAFRFATLVVLAVTIGAVPVGTVDVIVPDVVNDEKFPAAPDRVIFDIEVQFNPLNCWNDRMPSPSMPDKIRHVFEVGLTLGLEDTRVMSGNTVSPGLMANADVAKNVRISAMILFIVLPFHS